MGFKQLSELPEKQNIVGGEKVYINDNGVSKQVDIDKVKSDLTDYATKQYVDDEISQIPSPLPEVTSDDDGKVLKVVDGEWAKVDGADPILDNAKETGGIGWTGRGETTLASETVTTVSIDEVGYGPFTTPFDIVNGAYTVIFNGIKYNLNSTFSDELNLWLLGDYSRRPDFSRYPFVIANVDGASLLTESAGNYDVTIKMESDIAHKIDEKYLPILGNAKSTGGIGWTEEQTILVDNEIVTTVNDYGLSFSQFETPFDIVDGTYTVIFNGAEYNLNSTFFDGSGFWHLGDVLEQGPDFSRYPFFIAAQDEVAELYTESAGDYVVTVVKISETIHRIEGKYLPENLATKSDVKATQEMLDSVFYSVATFTFDKQTSERDTFVFIGFDYYKISNFNPAPEDVISFKGTREIGSEWSEIVAGNNCVEYGFFIVVASAGLCSIPVSETITYSFTAPSAGLYARYMVNNPYMTAGIAEFTLKPSNDYINGVFLTSSTTGSTKKFLITVDDSGTISATEVV